MKYTLITGANRGIGLEFVRQLIDRGDTVFAARRYPHGNEVLEGMQAAHPEQLEILPLDVREKEQAEELRKTIAKRTNSLDLLINNAGVYPKGEHFGNLKAEIILETLHTNSIAPILITQTFVDLLAAAKDAKVVNISSGMGSIAQSSGGSYSYRTSKAALNMLSKVLSADLRPKGIACIAMHPGWVKTDMGGSHASLSPEESVSSMISVIEGLELSDSGRFLQWDGAELPW